MMLTEVEVLMLVESVWSHREDLLRVSSNVDICILLQFFVVIEDTNLMLRLGQEFARLESMN
jgi:hypothetical protein